MKTILFKFGLICVSVFLLSACMEFKMLEFKGINGVQMPRMDMQNLDLKLNVKVFNPNTYNLKVKPSDIKVYVEENFMGTVHLDEKIKFKKNSEGTYDAFLKIELEKGAILSLMRYVRMEEVPVRFLGFVKGSVYGITKKVKVDLIKNVKGSDLNLQKLLQKQGE